MQIENMREIVVLQVQRDQLKSLHLLINEIPEGTLSDSSSRLS